MVPLEKSQGRTAVFEVMLGTTAIQNLIREGKTHQISTVIQTSAALGMKTMDQALLELYQQRVISKETLFEKAIDSENMQRYF